MWPCTRAQMSGFFLASLLEGEKAESHMHPPTLPTQTPKILVPAGEGGEGYRHTSVATEGASPGQSGVPTEIHEAQRLCTSSEEGRRPGEGQGSTKNDGAGGEVPLPHSTPGSPPSLKTTFPNGHWCISFKHVTQPSPVEGGLSLHC